MCEKLGHKTRVEAREHLRGLLSKGDNHRCALNVYQCKDCGRYHVGHSFKPVRKSYRIWEISA